MEWALPFFPAMSTPFTAHLYAPLTQARAKCLQNPRKTLGTKLESRLPQKPMPTQAKPCSADMAIHILRLLGCLCAWLYCIAHGYPAPSALFAAFLFFAAFALMHDCTHRALHLPKILNELALSASAFLMLMSGQALRRTHLLHHARPLSQDDIEGAPARMPLARVLLLSPYFALQLRAAAFRADKGQGQARQCIEFIINIIVLILALALGNQALRISIALIIALQLSMALWAAYIPHNAPPWMSSAAALLSFSRSPIALSLAFHQEHHAHPNIPCGRLHTLQSKTQKPSHRDASGL